MKQVITAIQVNVETSVFNDENVLVSRPPAQPIVAFQVDIPKPVLDWILEQMAKRGT